MNSRSFLCLLGALVCFVGLMGLSGVSQAAGAEGQNEKAAIDCRHEAAEDGADLAMPHAETGAFFPTDDVFRPLLPDPKQPQFFASYQTTRRRAPSVEVREAGQSVNVGSVGFGENFGFYTRRRGCDGWQVGVLAGVFSQFNLDASSTDLINADYVVGIPFSWRQNAWSTRIRLYHQSSHIGDEFLLGNPEFTRVNFSFEEVEAILSYDYRWARVYAGGGYLVHREPATLDRNRVQWGLELRAPTFASPVFKTVLPGLLIIPVFGADFKTFEELQWIINTNVVAGLEWSRAGGRRRLRMLVNYYRGFYPYGQFFNEKVESLGFGFYLAF